MRIIEALEHRVLFSVIALYDNPSYVAVSDGSAGDSVVNIRNTLIAQGNTVNTFTDLSSVGLDHVLPGTDVLVMPPLARSDAPVNEATREAVDRFITAGGGYLNIGDVGGNNLGTLNELFSYGAPFSSTASTTPATLDSTAATGTPFTDAPASLRAQLTTSSFTGGPSGTKAIYVSPGGASVALLPYAARYSIGYLGWNWDFSGSAGSQAGAANAGAWNDVLARAVHALPGQSPAPTVPANPSASSGTFTDHVHVAWDSEVADGFEVWRSTDNNRSNAFRLAAGVNSNSFDDTTAEANTTYFYWVRAAVGTNLSSFSDAVSGFVTAPGNSGSTGSSGASSTPPTTSSGTTPVAPVHVKAAESSAAVVLSWKASKKASYYQIMRSIHSGASAAVTIATNVTTTTYQDTSAKAGRTYYYFIRARNHNGASRVTSAIKAARKGSSVRAKAASPFAKPSKSSEAEFLKKIVDGV